MHSQAKLYIYKVFFLQYLYFQMSMIISGFDSSASSRPQQPQIHVSLYCTAQHGKLSYRGEMRSAEPKAKPLPDGYGERFYSDGSHYVGHWVQGKRDGYGELWKVQNSRGRRKTKVPQQENVLTDNWEVYAGTYCGYNCHAFSDTYYFLCLFLTITYWLQ